MGNVDRKPAWDQSKEAGVRLARLIERELGYVEGSIDPIALRLLIQAKWRQVAALAHTIHEGIMLSTEEPKP